MRAVVLPALAIAAATISGAEAGACERLSAKLDFCAASASWNLAGEGVVEYDNGEHVSRFYVSPPWESACSVKNLAGVLHETLVEKDGSNFPPECARDESRFIERTEILGAFVVSRIPPTEEFEILSLIGPRQVGTWVDIRSVHEPKMSESAAVASHEAFELTLKTVDQ